VFAVRFKKFASPKQIWKPYPGIYRARMGI
jgi:hypothetical protein